MRKYLLFLVPLLMLSCTSNEFKFSTDIDAEVIGTTNKYIGLKYDIYGVIIFQDVSIPTIGEFTYFKRMKTIPLTAFVKCDDRDGRDRVFISLTHRGSQFGNAKAIRFNKISMHSFITKNAEIPGFIWYKYNDVEYKDGISPQELRGWLKENGEEKSETKVTTTVKEEKRKDESL